MHALLCSHEAQDGEDHEASEEAGPAVDERKDDGIPGGAWDHGGWLECLLAAHGWTEQEGRAGVLTCSSCC